MRYRVRIPFDVTLEARGPFFARWGRDYVEVAVEADSIDDFQKKMAKAGERLGELLAEALAGRGGE